MRSFLYSLFAVYVYARQTDPVFDVVAFGGIEHSSLWMALENSRRVVDAKTKYL